MEMIHGTYADKERVTAILAAAFDANQSVNYMLPQDKKRKRRVRAMMDYCFEVCFHFGAVVLNRDQTACALLLYPEQKKTTLRSLYRDLQFVARCAGWQKLLRCLKREQRIKRVQNSQSEKAIAYLWFIGVDTAHQGNGSGSALLAEIIAQSRVQGRTIFLETSTPENIPWYRKWGFEEYAQADLGYSLHFFKHPATDTAGKS